MLNSTWPRPDVGMGLLRNPNNAQIENSYADQFVGNHQCLDWKDGAGETLQLWDCSAQGGHPVSANQQWTVRYA